MLFAVGGLAALAAATLLVLVPARRAAPPEPAVVEKRLPEEPAFSPDEAGRAYLEEAERYARSGRLAPAADVLAKARELAISDPGLNIRLLRLREEVETAAALRKAQSLVEAGETKQAAEAAKELLDRDPSNTAATAAAGRHPAGPGAQAAGRGGAARRRRALAGPARAPRRRVDRELQRPRHGLPG